MQTDEVLKITRNTEASSCVHYIQQMPGSKKKERGMHRGQMIITWAQR